MKLHSIKRIFAISLVCALFLWAPAVLLASGHEGGSQPSSAAGESPTMKSKLDTLLPPKSGGEDIPLPKGQFKTEIIPKAIGIFLGIAGVITTGVLVYAGVMLVISQGNEEEITKFKNILIWSIVGLVFITTSYAIVRGVLQLSFE
jgi:hypothetical protein